jgi:energy-converting hydrogenase Eha subunit C
MGAAADCESIGVGLLRQPVNSITTVAFVAAGLWIVTVRPDRRWVGVAVVATGTGSLLFHGPMPAGAEWAHDVTLAWLLLVVAGTGTRWEKTTHIPGLLGLGVLFAFIPAIADPLAVVITVIALVVRIRLDRSPHTRGALTLLGASAIIGRLGATGWPLCDPNSLLQTHGLWHVAAAAAVVWWATGADSGPQSVHTRRPES